VFSKHLPQNDTSLSAEQGQSTDFGTVSRRLQLARDLFRSLPDRDTPLRRKALKIWFDAAYTLSKNNMFIGRDEEVIQLAMESKDPYLLNMATQFSLLQWRDAAGIRAAFEQGNVGTAKELNDLYAAEFQSLDPKDQKSVTRYYGINQKILDDNAVAFQATMDNPT
jgi:hypothetical protein